MNSFMSAVCINSCVSAVCMNSCVSAVCMNVVMLAVCTEFCVLTLCTAVCRLFLNRLFMCSEFSQLMSALPDTTLYSRLSFGARRTFLAVTDDGLDSIPQLKLNELKNEPARLKEVRLKLY